MPFLASGMAKARKPMRGPAKLPSRKELERLLPHDERLPRKSSRPGQKHLVITGVIVGLLLLAVILLNVLHLLPWQLGGGEVAVVNGERISQMDLDAGYNSLAPEIRSQFTKAQFLNETVIPQALVLQEADRRGIEVTEEEIQAFVQGVLAAQNMSEEALDAQLEANGLTRAGFMDMVEKRLRLNRLLEKDLPPPEATEEEIASFFEINRGYFTATYGNITLQDARDGIRQYLILQKQQLAIQEYVARLRANATIIVGELE
jgi:parvulin-like peptidyl-prolyl isomerase